MLVGTISGEAVVAVRIGEYWFSTIEYPANASPISEEEAQTLPCGACAGDGSIDLEDPGHDEGSELGECGACDGTGSITQTITVGKPVYAYLHDVDSLSFEAHVDGFAVVPNVTVSFLDLDGWFLHLIGNGTLKEMDAEIRVVYRDTVSGRNTVRKLCTYRIGDPLTWDEATRIVSMTLVSAAYIENVTTELQAPEWTTSLVNAYGHNARFPICAGRVQTRVSTLLSMPQITLGSQVSLYTDTDTSPGTTISAFTVGDGLVPTTEEVYHIQELLAEGNQQGLACSGIATNGVVALTSKNIPSYTNLRCMTVDRVDQADAYGPDLTKYVPNSSILLGTGSVTTNFNADTGVLDYADPTQPFTALPEFAGIYIYGSVYNTYYSGGKWHLQTQQITARIVRQIGITIVMDDIRDSQERPFKMGTWKLYHIAYVMANRVFVPNTLRVKSAPRIYADQNPSDGITHEVVSGTITRPVFQLKAGTRMTLPFWSGLRCIPLCGYSVAMPIVHGVYCVLPDNSLYQIADFSLITHLAGGVWVSYTAHDDVTNGMLSILQGSIAPKNAWAAVLLDDALVYRLWHYHKATLADVSFVADISFLDSTDNTLISTLFYCCVGGVGFTPSSDPLVMNTVTYESGSADQVIPRLLMSSGKRLILGTDGVYTDVDLLAMDSEDCSNCGGSGVVGDEEDPCPTCEGSGQLAVPTAPEYIFRDDHIHDGSLQITFDDDASTATTFSIDRTLSPFNIGSLKVSTVPRDIAFREPREHERENIIEAYFPTTRTFHEVVAFWAEYYSSKWAIVNFTTYWDAIMDGECFPGSKVRIVLSTPIQYTTEELPITLRLRPEGNVTYSTLDFTGYVVSFTVDPATWLVQLKVRTNLKQGSLLTLS